tara:strand:- start:1133 stop:1390 length:258 start_codon:yes stop_codon:yes gene_type:complete
MTKHDSPGYPIQTPVTLSDCWKWVRNAQIRKAVHRKRGTIAGTDGELKLIARATEELGELSQAITRDGNELEEMGISFPFSFNLV